MPGTLIIGCGGTGCRVAKILADCDHSVLTINWHGSDIDLLPEGVDENSVSKKDAEEYLSRYCAEISLNMVGFSEVVLVTSSGGNLGSACIGIIRRCATERDCRFICLLTLPFIFEGERRQEALEKLPEFLDSADRTFVLDLQDSSSSEELMQLSIGEALTLMESFLVSASAKFSNMVCSMPFMSTFMSRSYYYFRGRGTTLFNAVDSVLSRVAVPLIPTSSDWRLVICPDRAADDADVQELVRNVTDRYGSVPEIIRNVSEKNGMIPEPSVSEGPGEGVSLFIPFSA